MSTQIDLARIVLLNRTTPEFTAANPVLLAGEAALADVGTVRPTLRFGDGVRPWTSLPIFGVGGAGALTVPFAIKATDGSDMLSLTAANGAAIAAGATANDSAFTVGNAATTNDPARRRQFLAFGGDGAGRLGNFGPAGNNGLQWTADQSFSFVGNARFPLEILTNVHVVNPLAGQVLTFQSGNWINSAVPAQALGALTDVQFSTLIPGNMLSWNGTRWVNAPLSWPSLTLGGLTDTAISAPVNGEVLTFDGTAGKWLNAVPPGLALNIVNPSQGQVLAWDETAEKWINSSLPGGAVISLGTLQDVVLTNPAAGQLLSYDAVNQRWVNGAPPASALAGLSDVALTAPTAGQLLTYSGTAWVNGGAVTFGTPPNNIAISTAGQVQMFGGAHFINFGVTGLAAINGGDTGQPALTIRPFGPAISDISLALLDAYGGSLNSFRANGYIGFTRLPDSGGNSANCFIDGNGWLMKPGSSRRFKTNIRSLARQRARDIVCRVRPVIYNSVCELDDPQRNFYGLIAEEIAEIDSALVNFDKQGRPSGVAYDRVLLMLLPLMQEILGMQEPETT